MRLPALALAVLGLVAAGTTSAAAKPVVVTGRQARRRRHRQGTRPAAGRHRRRPHHPGRQAGRPDARRRHPCRPPRRDAAPRADRHAHPPHHLAAVRRLQPPAVHRRVLAGHLRRARQSHPRGRLHQRPQRWRKDYDDVGLRQAVDAGFVEGPRITTATYAIGSTGGHCDSTFFPPSMAQKSPAIIDNPEAGRPDGPAAPQVRRPGHQDLRHRRGVLARRHAGRPAAHRRRDQGESSTRPT